MQQRDLLGDVFISSLTDLAGVNAKKFIASHEDYKDEIESLIETRMILLKDKTLSLSLVGLSVVAESVPEAESVLFLCSHIFDKLRVRFRVNPDTPLSVDDISTLVDMPVQKVSRALSYLLDAPIWETYSGNGKIGYSSIVLSLGMLDYKSLPDLIAALRQGRANKFKAVSEQRANAPHSPPIEKPVQATRVYVDQRRLEALRSASNNDWDLKRLIRMCEELNSNYEKECYIACSALVRCIVDHVPPIFGCKTFSEVANNYSGGVSFRKSMANLDKSLRNIADSNIHTQIRTVESLPTETQISFWADLDKLLEEVVRLLAKPKIDRSN